MKNNIITMLLIIAAILTTNVAMAQEGRQQNRPQGPPPIPSDEQIEEMVADLAKTISLSDEQQEKVSELYFDHFEEVAEMQEKNKGSRGAGREAMQKLNEELQEDVNALLNEEQQKLYASWLEDQSKNRGKRGSQRGPRE